LEYSSWAYQPLDFIATTNAIELFNT